MDSRSASSRSRVRGLQHCRSRPDGGKLGQLVNLEMMASQSAREIPMLESASKAAQDNAGPVACLWT
jgi:hypothetical protein